MEKEKILYYLRKLPAEVVLALCAEVLAAYQSYTVESLLYDLFEELKQNGE